MRCDLPYKYEYKSSIPLFVYHSMFHQTLLIMCIIAFHFKLQLFYKKSKIKTWQVVVGWWLLAVDDISDLLLVAPAKADGGGGGPVVWLVGWVEDR